MSAVSLIVIASALMLGVGVPLLTMWMIAPSLAEGPRVENYRGRPVFAGLGIAWLVWSGAAIVMGIAGASVEGEQSLLPLLTLAGPLALVCFALGLVDDAYGTGASRGFSGHLAALRRGRLTTGGLKLFGISLASYVAALVVAQAPGDGSAAALLTALPGGAAVALTANLVNLTDLRPARALKVYLVLGIAGVISAVVGLGGLADANAEQMVTGAIVLALFVVGPVVAIWGYDARERGMLGDAGANAAGAVAGLLIVSGLPLAGTVAYLLLVLALNVASERFSFTRVIESSASLRWLDSLGRRGAEDTDDNDRHTGTNPE